MKRLRKTISILSVFIILAIVAYYVYAYYNIRNEYEVLLKASETMIKEEIAKNGATANGGDRTIKLFIKEAYLTDYKTDGWERYNFKWKCNNRKRGHDGWISRDTKGLYYIKSFWTPSGSDDMADR